MLAIQAQWTHPVSHIVFSPDGGSLATLQPHSGVTLLDRATGQVKATMPVPCAGELQAAAFCGGGTKLVVASSKRLHLFETATGSCLAQAGGWMFAVRELSAPRDEVLALTWNGLREVRLPQERGEVFLSQSRPLTTRATLVALSPCGRWVVGAYARNGLSLSSVETRRVVAELRHRSQVSHLFGVAFAADGSRLAARDGNEVLVYDTPPPDRESEVGSQESAGDSATRPQPGVVTAPKPRLVLEPVFRLAPPTDHRPATPARFPFRDGNVGWYPPVALTPEGRGLLVRRPRNRVQLWDVVSGKQTNEWSWRIEVTSLAVAPDGLTAVAGGRFGRVVMWDLE